MYFDVNGRKAFATTGGKPLDKDLPTVIFLHGSGLDHTFWGLHSRFFAFRNYAVLALDTPGPILKVHHWKASKRLQTGSMTS